MPFGCALNPRGGARFSRWAPSSALVQLDLTLPGAQEATRHAMQCLDGWHEIELRHACAGASYQFVVQTREARALAVPDPASRSNPQGVHRASMIVDLRWQERLVPPHRARLDFIRELLALRRQFLAPHLSAAFVPGTLRSSMRCCEWNGYWRMASRGAYSFILACMPHMRAADNRDHGVFNGQCGRRNTASPAGTGSSDCRLRLRACSMSTCSESSLADRIKFKGANFQRQPSERPFFRLGAVQGGR